MHLFAITLVVLLYLPEAAFALPLENGVQGDPIVECGGSFIAVKFNTLIPFEGHIFVKDEYEDPACRVDATNTTSVSIKLPFKACSKDPPGAFVSTTLVVSFHQFFITKVDRIYMVQCFYMEMETFKTTEIQVSMLTTTFQTQQVPMPVCRYEVLSGGPTGAPVLYAKVGDTVYHKWTCDTETVDTFCMVVHSCKVDDGAGDIIQLLDQQGCALDKYLLSNLEYITDLMAGKDAHVFKYADRNNLYFDCQISISVKEPAAQCPTPVCPEPKRSRRAHPSSPYLSRRPSVDSQSATVNATVGDGDDNRTAEIWRTENGGWPLSLCGSLEVCAHRWPEYGRHDRNRARSRTNGL
uniref:ZP domain-containing protein n=1 Tax=Plectus sambesii TaxID=2011161 RepID=A0A914V744_9BILA